VEDDEVTAVIGAELDARTAGPRWLTAFGPVTDLELVLGLDDTPGTRALMDAAHLEHEFAATIVVIKEDGAPVLFIDYEFYGAVHARFALRFDAGNRGVVDFIRTYRGGRFMVAVDQPTDGDSAALARLQAIGLTLDEDDLRLVKTWSTAVAARGEG
jgi:hypothetical protein